MREVAPHETSLWKGKNFEWRKILLKICEDLLGAIVAYRRSIQNALEMSVAEELGFHIRGLSSTQGSPLKCIFLWKDQVSGRARDLRKFTHLIIGFNCNVGFLRLSLMLTAAPNWKKCSTWFAYVYMQMWYWDIFSVTYCWVFPLTPCTLALLIVLSLHS